MAFSALWPPAGWSRLLEIRVGNAEPSLVGSLLRANPLCAFVVNASFAQNVSCGSAMSGRYITIQRSEVYRWSNTSGTNFASFSLCEVVPAVTTTAGGLLSKHAMVLICGASESH